MSELLIQVKNSLAAIGEIAVANKEQLNNISGVNNALFQFSNSISQNSTSSEEMATSAKELAAQAEMLKTMTASFISNREKDKTPTTELVTIGKEVDGKEILSEKSDIVVEESTPKKIISPQKLNPFINLNDDDIDKEFDKY